MEADYQKVINDYMQRPDMNLKERYDQHSERYNSSTEQQKVEAYKRVYAFLDQKIGGERLSVEIQGIKLLFRPTVVVFHHLFKNLSNPENFEEFLKDKSYKTYFEMKAEQMQKVNPAFRSELIKVWIKQQYNVDLSTFEDREVVQEVKGFKN